MGMTFRNELSSGSKAHEDESIRVARALRAKKMSAKISGIPANKDSLKRRHKHFSLTALPVAVITNLGRKIAHAIHLDKSA